MSHFEDFDRRKAELAEAGQKEKTEDERRLKESLHALNRAIHPERPDARLIRARDEVWALGTDLYGWTG